jgi:hypothetical protein
MFRRLDLFPSSGERETPTLSGHLERANLNHWTTRVQVPVILRPTVSRPVRLGVVSPSGILGQIFITVGHLRSSCFGVPSLTRRRVCNLLVLAELVFTFYFFVWAPPPLARTARYPYLYTPRTGWPSYIPGLWVPFLSTLTTHSATVE